MKCETEFEIACSNVMNDEGVVTELSQPSMYYKDQVGGK